MSETMPGRADRTAELDGRPDGRPDDRPVALTIAGSDSSGGAGIQADLRVFHRLGAFGTSAITAVTAQNLDGVTGVTGIAPDLVRAQISAVLEGFPVTAAKTGMLWSRDIVATVAEAIVARNARSDDGSRAEPRAASPLAVVVDPVMVATSGARLLDEDAVDAYRTLLLPHAALATPNLDEAAVLLGDDAITRDRLRAAADRLFERFGCPILLKGGHLHGDPIDVLCHADGLIGWRHPRVEGVNTHGSGCMLSAAIAAGLAAGDALQRACERGLAFVHDALARGCRPTPGIRLADVERARADTAVLELVAL